jgi:hypothetical protein
VLTTQFKAYASALVSDAAPVASSNPDPLMLARETHGVVFAGDNQHVYGGIQSNGRVYRADAKTNTEVTPENVATVLPNFHGPLRTALDGTAAELPDYTVPGAAQQLFDFKKFEDAAKSGHGASYDSLAKFAAAMNLANAENRPLQGMIYVTVDANDFPSSARITSVASSGAVTIPGGIRVDGTLAFHVTHAPSDAYPLSIQTSLSVNAVKLPATFDPEDPQTFASGYPATMPSELDAHTAIGFKLDDDLPAIATDGGALEILRGANVCGIVYAPSFLRIEDPADEPQFFQGGLIAGAGIFAQSGATANGAQVIAFDPSTFDSLRTFDRLGKAPVLTGYLIDK